MENYLILASSSPGRKELLQKIGITPNLIIAPNISEEVRKGEAAYEYIKRLAQEKAMIIFDPKNLQSLGTSNKNIIYIIAADTTVVRGSKIIGKAENAESAKGILKLLSGNRHTVLTAFCVIKAIKIADKNEYKIVNKPIIKVNKSTVSVKKLSEQEINWYLESDQWQGKAGGYEVTGIFELFIKQINGSLSNIIGLPLLSIYNSLLGLGYPFNYIKGRVID
ncbi:Maf-like protein [Candidatus Hepatincolaceae symbiont of Richtersius coronifer]